MGSAQVYILGIASIIIVAAATYSILALIGSRKSSKSSLQASYNISASKNKGTINTNYKQLKISYENVQQQYRHWYIFSSAIIVGGALTILSVIISLQVISTITALIMLMIGTAVICIGVILFSRTRGANKETDLYYNEKFLEAENLSQLISLILENPDPKAQNHLKETIILQILASKEKQKQKLPALSSSKEVD